LRAAKARNEAPFEDRPRAVQVKAKLKELVQEPPILHRCRDDLPERAFMTQKKAHRTKARKCPAITEQHSKIVAF
jgi:hypothetical protein